MTDSVHRIREDALAHLARDPVLCGSDRGAAAKRRVAARRRCELARSIARLIAVSSPAGPIAALLERHGEGIASGQSIVAHSWWRSLVGALDWVDAGAAEGILDRLLDADRLAALLCWESSAAALRSTGARLLPARLASACPGLDDRLDQCLPGLHGPAYLPDAPGRLDRISKHLDRSIARLHGWSPTLTRDLAGHVRTFILSTRRDPLCAFSSSNGTPATVVAALSEARLADDDVDATAAQLAHELGHVKLGVMFGAAEELPPELCYISPFKNDLQTLESIVHMAYTIGLECLCRIVALGGSGEEPRARGVAFLVDYGARHELVSSITHHALASCGGAAAEPARVIPPWAMVVPTLIERLVALEPVVSRRMHSAQREKVRQRHSWDIGQAVLRGVFPRDPELGSVRDDNGGAVVEWGGRRQRVTLQPHPGSPKDYGSYLAVAGCRP